MSEKCITFFSKFFDIKNVEWKCFYHVHIWASKFPISYLIVF